MHIANIKTAVITSRRTQPHTTSGPRAQYPTSRQELESFLQAQTQVRGHVDVKSLLSGASPPCQATLCDSASDSRSVGTDSAETQWSSELGGHTLLILHGSWRPFIYLLLLDLSFSLLRTTHTLHSSLHVLEFHCTGQINSLILLDSACAKYNWFHRSQLSCCLQTNLFFIFSYCFGLIKVPQHISLYYHPVCRNPVFFSLDLLKREEINYAETLHLNSWILPSDTGCLRLGFKRLGHQITGAVEDHKPIWNSAEGHPFHPGQTSK